MQESSVMQSVIPGGNSHPAGFWDVSKMTKTLSVFGLCASIALLALVYFNAPGASRVEAREDASACPTAEVALDEGYGVSLTETRTVCPR
jgi:hypothetical protein